MLLFAVLVLSLFIIWLLWLYADPRPLRSRLKDKILIAYAVVYLIVVPQIFSFFYYPMPTTKWDPFIISVGFLLFFLGLWFDIWARLTMRKYWGPPGQHDINRQSKLIKTGPFAVSRNPIYLGTFFLILGFSLAIRSQFFFLTFFLLLYFSDQIYKEERLLKRHFGEEYDNYKKRVPRFLGYKWLAL